MVNEKFMPRYKKKLISKKGSGSTKLMKGKKKTLLEKKKLSLKRKIITKNPRNSKMMSTPRNSKMMTERSSVMGISVSK
jgi:hypothetical protein